MLEYIELNNTDNVNENHNLVIGKEYFAFPTGNYKGTLVDIITESKEGGTKPPKLKAVLREDDGSEHEVDVSTFLLEETKRRDVDCYAITVRTVVQTDAIYYVKARSYSEASELARKASIDLDSKGYFHNEDGAVDFTYPAQTAELSREIVNLDRGVWNTSGRVFTSKVEPWEKQFEEKK